MESKYKMVIFDVDGTMLDTSEGIISSVEYVIHQQKLPALTHSQLLNFIGPPIQQSFQKYYSCSKQEAQRLADSFRVRYKDYDLLKAKPYEGIYDLWNYLKSSGAMLAVATYKREDYAACLMEHFRFTDYTRIIYGADNNNIRTKADIVNLCIKDAAYMLPSEALVIGDSVSDGEAARVNQCDFLGVTYGFGTKEKQDFHQVPSVYIASDIADIVNWLKL